MVLNTTTDPTTKTSAGALGEQQLEATVSELRAQLEIERAEREQLQLELERQPQADDLQIIQSGNGNDADNIYVFDDDDVTGAAFDKFFTAPDPGLDKIRSFLLD